jgi:hypothetical protein
MHLQRRPGVNPAPGHPAGSRRAYAPSLSFLHRDRRSSRVHDGVVDLTLRLLLCPECRCLPAICERCDSGRITCSDACSRVRRARRVREAGRRYQATPRGAALHAERQRRCRARQATRVTHQPDVAPAPQQREHPTITSPPVARRPTTCARCGASSEFFRTRTAYPTLRNARTGARRRPARRAGSRRANVASSSQVAPA